MITETRYTVGMTITTTTTTHRNHRPKGNLTMTTTPDTKPYYLSFFGSHGAPYHLPRHRKNHETLESARAEATRVNALRTGSAKAACPALIHGPDRDHAA